MTPSLLEGDGSLAPSLEQTHRSLVQVNAERLLATSHSSGTTVVPLPDCMGLISDVWGSKSETVSELGF